MFLYMHFKTMLWYCYFDRETGYPVLPVQHCHMYFRHMFRYCEILLWFCYYIRETGCPVLHLSPVASGRAVSRDDRLRQMFSSKCGALVFDSELDAVLDSVLGNCRDSFLCLRGVADYRGDGSRRSEWQPYAALAAASVLKAVICAMEPPQDN